MPEKEKSMRNSKASQWTENTIIIEKNKNAS